MVGPDGGDPAGRPHRAEALEDTVDIDVFSPIRQDLTVRTPTSTGSQRPTDRPGWETGVTLPPVARQSLAMPLETKARRLDP